MIFDSETNDLIIKSASQDDEGFYSEIIYEKTLIKLNSSGLNYYFHFPSFLTYILGIYSQSKQDFDLWYGLTF